VLGRWITLGIQPAGDAVFNWNIVDEAGRPRKTATVFDMGYAHALHTAGERDVCKPPLLIEVLVYVELLARSAFGERGALLGQIVPSSRASLLQQKMSIWLSRLSVIRRFRRRFSGQS
jgi:hypothetical protein